MRISVFSHYFTPEVGAPSARIYDLSQQWLRMGHDVSVITGFPNHPIGEVYPGYELRRYMYEELDGIDVHRNWTYITPNKGVIKRTLGHISFWPSARLWSGPRLGPVDVAVGTSPTLFAPMAAMGVARRRGIPFIMEVRDLWPALLIELGVITNKQIIDLLEKWELWMYRKASKIVTVTEAFRQNLIERGISEDKIHTIPNGADPDFWHPRPKSTALRRDLGLSDKYVILYIGTHGLSQGLSSIVDAASLLKDQDDIHFLFVGEGAKKEALVDQAKSFELNNITFHDAVTKAEVPDFYALSDVCLVPLKDISLFETFIPSKIFEILSMARPVIGSLRGESADILRRSNAALVVYPEDSDAVASAILDLYNNPEHVKEMGKNGRRFVIRNYSRKALAQNYIEVIRCAVEES
jgi:glycosyltransferase involved in cell wall biosynthesis